MNFPKPPIFTDPAAARAHGLAELATAFRVFGKLGYDEGVAGHLTVSQLDGGTTPKTPD